MSFLGSFLSSSLFSDINGAPNYGENVGNILRYTPITVVQTTPFQTCYWVARAREREIENLNCARKFHRKPRKTTFQRRDKYFFCMYCINKLFNVTFAYMFSVISDL